MRDDDNDMEIDDEDQQPSDQDPEDLDDDEAADVRAELGTDFWNDWEACCGRLMGWAIWFTGGTKGGTDQDNQRGLDLYEAAFAKILAGKRRRPPDVTMYAFGKGVMKSILSNRAKNLSELVLAPSYVDDEDEYGRASPWHDPADEGMNPEEAAIDNEGSAIAAKVADETYDSLREGTLAKRVMDEAINQNVNVASVARALGVSMAQVTEARRQLRKKLREIGHKYGLRIPVRPRAKKESKS